MLIFYGFIFILTINYSTGIVHENLSSIKHETLQKPGYVKDPYLFLMFNDPNDASNLGTFSEYMNPITKQLMYRGKWETKVTNSTPFTNDFQLILESHQSYHAISFPFSRPVSPKPKCLVIQYDYRFPTNHICGGAYIKLFSKSFQPRRFSNNTDYVMLFGPNKCGNDYVIKFEYKYQEKNGDLVNRTPENINDYKYFPHYLGDNVTQVTTLQICDNQTYRIYKNLKVITEGHLVNDFEPSPGGVKTMLDLSDEKPSYWDSREEIPDPDFKIPHDYDPNEPEFITDMNAKKPYNWLDDEPLMVRSTDPRPQDWDEQKKGMYRPPMIRNPKCRNQGCGKWQKPIIRNPKYQPPPRASIIPNPNYMGKWKPRRIANPQFNEDEDVYSTLMDINNLGIEVWAENGGVYFDNFIVTYDIDMALKFGLETWWPKFLVDSPDPSYYRERLMEVFDPNYIKRKRKRSFSYYFHWLWAILPFLLGLPLLTFIVALIRRQSLSKRNIIQMRAKQSWSTSQKPKREKEAYNFSSGDDYQPLSKQASQMTNMSEISEQSISKLFGGENDVVADVLRKRVRRMKKMEMERGDE